MNKYIYVLAFTAGMCIMAVELCASRLMAPYFGTSTFVWTNIIGVIMIALAIGYIIGGRLADSHPDLKVLNSLICLGCLWLLLIPWLTPFLIKQLFFFFSSVNSAAFFIFGGSLIAIILLFVLPIILLGATSPFLIKILSINNKNIGNVAGLIFGVSTIGSIVGTFVPVLIFIPIFGTSRTIIFFATILFVLSVIGFFSKKHYLLILILILPWLINLPEIKSSEGKIIDTESEYQYIQVDDIGEYRYLRFNDGMGIQSMYKKGEKLTGHYYDFFSLLPAINQAQEALIVGLAGGTIANQLINYYPQIKVDGVEIDPKVIEIAQEYFALNPQVNIFNQDGRIYLTQSDKKYDLIVIDAYSQQMYIPFHLATKEFFKLVSQHLNENGVVAMNVNAASPDSKLLRSITNALNLVFKNVAIIPDQSNSYNYLVLASDTEIIFPVQPISEDLANMSTYAQANIQKVNFDSQYDILTDDRSPIEFYTDWMILDYLFKNVN